MKPDAQTPTTAAEPAPASAPAPDGPQLREAWRELRAREPQLRQRDAAARLGVSEAELVASQLGQGATLLDTRWMEILTALESCGPLTALSRNEVAVIEHKGAYMNVSNEGPMARAEVPHLDLRLFLRTWKYAFAYVEALDDGPRHSVQVFDERGGAVHKVFLGKEADPAAWQALLAAHAVTATTIEPPARRPPRQERPDADIDVAGLTAAWSALQDTHEFHGLLRTFNVGRTQALRLTPTWATRVSPLAHRRVFEACRDLPLPLMVFVGNRGIIQIHTGIPRKLVQMERWFNVMDPDWNLHLLEGGVDSAWVVRKPTKDGVVTSLELFDGDGEIIALLFSKRHDGQREEPRWTETLSALPAPS
jgi:putative hemin transport protein